MFTLSLDFNRFDPSNCEPLRLGFLHELHFQHFGAEALAGTGISLVPNGLQRNSGLSRVRFGSGFMFFFGQLFREGVPEVEWLGMRCV